MQINKSSSQLFGGIDHISLDTRTFDPSQVDIESICRFFSLGKLKIFQKEKNITLSHSNFFVFASTTRGNYALKFYPASSSKDILHEYALNRYLGLHGFPTPAMLTSSDGKTSVPFCGSLAVCFEYINGQQAWQHIHKKTVQDQINGLMRQLKTVLLPLAGSKFISPQDSFAAQIKNLIQTASQLTPFYNERNIRKEINHIAQEFAAHKKLFVRQILHNNATLTNFMISKGKVFLLDLSHIKEDYLLSDMTALVLSCRFLRIPPKITKTMIGEYFLAHGLKKPHQTVLNTQMRLSIIREYLKNTSREKNLSKARALTTGQVERYKLYLSQRTKHLVQLLRQLNPAS